MRESLRDRTTKCGHEPYYAKGLCRKCYRLTRYPFTKDARNERKRIQYRDNLPLARQRSREKNRKYRDVAIERNRLRRKTLRSEVIAAYGGKCVCPNCPETNEKFLTIDHINNDGAAHKRQIGRAGLYRWLKQNGFPEGFQVLCWNCNCGRAVYGVCPHGENE